MKKILIVEDDNFLSNAYRVKLTKAGYKIVLASDGQQAINTLESFIPDLILLDLVMPRMDGFAVLEKLKANELSAKIPVIVTSNLGQKEDIDRAINLGANSYVVKSDLSLDDLVKKIKAAIGS
jgi:two-component system phosphate regulon response regulator PhoB/two-component system alkaline phosphatase synthesis response regulator PhoP